MRRKMQILWIGDDVYSVPTITKSTQNIPLIIVMSIIFPLNLLLFHLSL